ncbi:MAG: fluoride efflux transporter CrcB [Eubacterium sp.]|nr:fluoride efflux transporter CrcB [Eubacterium sp.]
MTGFLCVALGGAIGAAGRYAISLIPVKMEYPILTLVTNILGAILIGFIVGMATSHPGMSKNVVLLLKTGVCGGFTTFSTFSLEAVQLLENKSYVAGGSYMVLSVVCCLLGIFAGRRIAMVVA